jgi:hypothetical protein
MDDFEKIDLIQEINQIEEDMANYFDGIDDPNYGDLGYQRLAEKRDELKELLNNE